MNGCSGNTSVCDLRDIRPVKLPFRHELVLMCAGCRGAAAGMGLQVIERRVDPVPVDRDRRRFVAPWRRNAAAKDLTGATR